MSDVTCNSEGDEKRSFLKNLGSVELDYSKAIVSNF